jgi:hypothetical protein
MTTSAFSFRTQSNRLSIAERIEASLLAVVVSSAGSV